MSMALQARVSSLEHRVKELEEALTELTRIIAAAPRATLTTKPVAKPPLKQGAPI